MGYLWQGSGPVLQGDPDSVVLQDVARLGGFHLERNLLHIASGRRKRFCDGVTS